MKKQIIGVKQVELYLFIDPGEWFIIHVTERKLASADGATLLIVFFVYNS